MSSLTENELRQWIALWRAPKIGPAQFAVLLRHFPTLDALFIKPRLQLQSYHLSPETLDYLAAPDWRQIDLDCAWAKHPDHRIITWQDSLYPPSLKEICNAPPLLFVKGDASLLSSQQLAIVGSRSPTSTGREIAEQFAKHLSLSGLTITSGLALGIDAASHLGALEGSGKTIAVMATGMDTIYPKDHQALATRIAETGAILTEFPLGVPVQAKHFPRRNRIVSGLSLGTLVVEASTRSGSLITARLANEQGREVFVIPGSIYNPNARGCHQLIQQGAKLITSTADITEELGPLMTFNQGALYQGQSSRHSDALMPETAKEAPHCIDLLTYMGYEITTVDDLVKRSGLTAADISSILLKLELGGMISAAPGGYVRTA